MITDTGQFLRLKGNCPFYFEEKCLKILWIPLLLPHRKECYRPVTHSHLYCSLTQKECTALLLTVTSIVPSHKGVYRPCYSQSPLLFPHTKECTALLLTVTCEYLLFPHRKRSTALLLTVTSIVPSQKGSTTLLLTVTCIVPSQKGEYRPVTNSHLYLFPHRRGVLPCYSQSPVLFPHRKESTALLLTVTCEYLLFPSRKECTTPVTNSHLWILVLFPHRKGEYRRVETVEQLREMMATFYSRPVFSTNSGDNAVYTVPYHDGFGFG